jgi:type I restriction enzyme R subunit
MTPEQKARKDIDRLLSLAGWTVQSRDKINLGASLGVAVREYPTNSGPVDYALFVDRKAIGVIEAKPAGTTLSGVAVQSEGYGHNFPDSIQHFILPAPEILAHEIVENLGVALEQFESIVEELENFTNPK